MIGLERVALNTETARLTLSARQGVMPDMKTLQGHWQLILITALVFLLWNTPLVLPLKILVVFLHELAHAFAALMTGGSVERISLSAQQGGYAATRGGNGFVIVSAGYVGSLLIGVTLLLIALRTDADRLVLGLFGFLCLLVAALYVRELFPFGFCIVAGTGMLATAWFCDHRVSDMVLRVIGLTSAIYVPYDIFDDTIRRTGVRSDAYQLSEQFGGSPALWGGLWLVLSFGVIAVCLRYWIGPESNLHFGAAARR